ncbi:MAG: elongation factor P [Vicinamibacteria bacterium]|nr:elongation factor P [Vicinamibacteria bacterium]
MIQATQIRRGMCIKHENELYRVVSMQHITPGNWRGMVQAKIRSLRTGAIVDHRFRSEDRVERAVLEEVTVQYLYHEGSLYHFMNSETYEQTALDEEILGDAISYLTPEISLKVEMFDDRPVGIELPLTVELEVMETEPSIKGASVSNQSKPAKMETGLIVNVPPFISIGDVVKIDTSSGAYIERIKAS